jgi:hypothetical protein
MVRLSGIINLNELISAEGVPPKQRNKVIDEAVKEGILTGRRLKKEDIFIFDGVERDLVKDKLLGEEEAPDSLEDIDQYFKAEEVETFEEPDKLVSDEELDSRLGILEPETVLLEEDSA